jgi:hypothetical protein
MAKARRVELDDLVNRPGTYYNPQTEVLLVVDDGVSLDTEIFDTDDDGDGPEWVLISDEVPVDEAHRDELLEAFQVQDFVAGEEDEDDDYEEDELEPDPDEDE